MHSKRTPPNPLFVKKRGRRHTIMFDIVIPVLNEEKLLQEKRDYYQWLKIKGRLIFVDGGSLDRTREIAKDLGEVISSSRGRARQMNAGAGIGQSPNLLFLHVDTFVSEEAFLQMEKIWQTDVCAGCFSMRIVERGFIFRAFESLVNFRARRFKIIDGDLGLFVKREVFERLGGFDSVSVMEDILFSRKLRRVGKAAALAGNIFVSARRWRQNGFWKTFLQYSRAYFDLWTGKIK